jgi:hypothetical protein
MRHFALVSVVALLNVSVGAASAAPSAGSATRTVLDPAWGMAAADVALPKGWKFDGVASHGDTCVTTLPDVRYAAESRDGTIAIQHYPQIRYSYSNNPQQNRQNQQAGCLITPFVKPADFLTHVVAPALRPGARYEVHELPASVTEQQRAEAQEFDRHLSQGGTMSHTEFSTMLLGFSFTRAGVSTLEGFLGTFRCTQTIFAATHLQTVECMIDNGMDVRAPSNRMGGVLKSNAVRVRLTAAWESRARALLAQRFAGQDAQMQTMFQRDRQGLIALHKSLMDEQAARYEAGMQRARAAADARHAAAVGTTNHMGDVNDYRDPTTGTTYKLSNQYAHTYLDGSGKTILQTDSSYAPGPNTIWQELEPHP